MLEEAEGKQAKRAALNLLAIQGRHSLELQRKLKLRGFSEGAIAYALAECTRLGFLNDAEQTQAMVAALQRRGYGPRYITAKLRSKGIPVELADSGQEAAIAALLQKRRFADKDKKKVVAALCRRGFALETVFKVLQQLAR